MRLHIIHGLDELLLGLGDLLILSLESQVDQLLPVDDGVDGGFDVRALFMNPFKSLQPLSDDLDVLFAFKGAFKESEEVVDFVLVVVDVTHGLQSSHHVLKVLVEFLGSVTDVVHGSGVVLELIDFVTKLIQVLVKCAELVFGLPITKLSLAGV